MIKPVRLVDQARDELLAEGAKYGMAFTRAVRAAFRLIARFPEAWAAYPKRRDVRRYDEAVPVRDRLSRAGQGDPCACRGRDQATTGLLAPSWLTRSRRRSRTTPSLMSSSRSGVIREQLVACTAAQRAAADVVESELGPHGLPGNSQRLGFVVALLHEFSVPGSESSSSHERAAVTASQLPPVLDPMASWTKHRVPVSRSTASTPRPGSTRRTSHTPIGVASWRSIHRRSSAERLDPRLRRKCAASGSPSNGSMYASHGVANCPNDARSPSVSLKRRTNISPPNRRLPCSMMSAASRSSRAWSIAPAEPGAGDGAVSTAPR